MAEQPTDHGGAAGEAGNQLIDAVALEAQVFLQQLFIWFGDRAGELHRGGAALDEVGGLRIFFDPGGLHLIGLPGLGDGLKTIAQMMPHQGIDGAVGQFLIEDGPEGFDGERRQGIHSGIGLSQGQFAFSPTWTRLG